MKYSFADFWALWVYLWEENSCVLWVLMVVMLVMLEAARVVEEERWDFWEAIRGGICRESRDRTKNPGGIMDKIRSVRDQL